MEVVVGGEYEHFKGGRKADFSFLCEQDTLLVYETDAKNSVEYLSHDYGFVYRVGRRLYVSKLPRRWHRVYPSGAIYS